MIPPPAQLAHTLASILDAYDDEAGLMSADGCVFQSTRSGSAQLYLSTRAGAPRQLTSVNGGVLTHTVGAQFALFSHRPADQTTPRIYRVGLHADATPSLLAGDDAHARWQAFAAGQQVLVEARAVARPGFRLELIGAADSSPRVAFEAHGAPGWLRGFSQDGRHALVLRMLSLSSRELLLIDLVRGACRTLWPTADKAGAMIHEAAFSVDGERVFAAVSDGSDGARLMLWDCQRGRLCAHAPLAARGGVSALATGAGQVAVTLNHGHRTTVEWLDSSSLQSRGRIQMPLGVGAATSFGREELICHWSTPAAPARLQHVTLGSGARRCLNPPPEAAEPVLQIEQLVAADGMPIPLHVVRPADVSEPLPTVIFLHGGPTACSSLGFSARQQFFLALGCAVVEPNIRGSAGYGRDFELADNGPAREQSFADIACVASWLETQPWADTSRLLVHGQSYGGYLALIALTRYPRLFRAGIDAYGISDWPSFFAQTNPGTRAVFAQEVGDPEQDSAFLQHISPLRALDALERPLFVYHGARDTQVPVSQSLCVAQAIRARGGRVELMIAEDEAHGMAKRSTQLAFYERLAEFLRDVL